MLQESGFIGSHWELLTRVKILSYVIFCKIRATNFASLGLPVSCDSSQRVDFVMPANKSCYTTARLRGYPISSYQIEMFRTMAGGEDLTISSIRRYKLMACNATYPV